MKRLTYLLALGALLTLGTGCDKESTTDNQQTQVPLYVNTWAFTSGDASTDKGPQTVIYAFNANKTFWYGNVATESLIDEIKRDFLPSTDSGDKEAPTIDGDTPATDGDAADSEITEEHKEIIEKINSIQVGDIVIMSNGMYVETTGEKDDVYLSLFILYTIQGNGTNIELAESMGGELHILNVTENTLTIKDDRSEQSEKEMKSLATSGITVGKFVDCSDFMK